MDSCPNCIELPLLLLSLKSCLLGREAGAGVKWAEGSVTSPLVPHHRTCGSLYGGLVVELAFGRAWQSDRVEVGHGKRDV